MRELGNDVVAELFLRLARLEKEHEQELKRRAAGLVLPRIALEAEVRAAAFFESARKQGPDPALAELAAEMAAEEGVHIAWVKSAIRGTPDPVIDWSSIFG
jgi:rubrerythrin